ncbi:MAG: rhodanese-like domain-containing protein [Phycisphaerales bacterium]|nr:rhodanese-like domain-containing protein [Phycisphaerales bacterium]
MTRLAYFLLIPTIALASCGKSVSDKDVHWLSVDEAQEAIAAQSGSWLSEPMENVWVDPRNAAFYNVGHIPGALNVQLSDPDGIGRLKPFGTIIVYGEGYQAPIADAMIKALITEGHDDVKGLELGYDGWIAAGQPLAKGTDAGRVTSSTTGDRWQRVHVEQD